MTDGTEVAEPGTEVAVAAEPGAVATQAEQPVVPAEEHGGHPDVKQYVMIAVVLVIVTALEIATSYIDTGHTNLIILALSAMAVVKFVLVTGWYMHMKSDNPLFRRFFVVGIIGASIVYGIVFLVFSSTVLKSSAESVIGAVPFPAWQAHPDVWLLVAFFGIGYALALSQLGPRLAPAGTPVATRFQVVSFSAGVLALWVASDWPIHDVAERYLFSVHMVQHVAYSMIAAPLLLIGTPTWLARWLLSPRWLLATVRYLARLIPATIVFNVVVVVTHTPVVVNAALEHALLHFAIHTLIFVSSIIVWLPLLSPLPEVPRLAPLVRMLFLFLQSIIPTVPASFLTFGARPLYSFYDHVPRLFGLSALSDMQIAGVIMKIGVGLTLWLIIAIIFFRWYSTEEAPGPSRRVSRDLERELMGLRQP